MCIVVYKYLLYVIYIQFVYWYINTYCMYHSSGILDNKWESSTYMFVMIKCLNSKFCPQNYRTACKISFSFIKSNDLYL